MKIVAEIGTKTKWVLDPSHSELGFRVKHLMISKVKGEFRKFEAEIDGDDFSTASATVSIDTSSVFTNDESRDAHLKSADFFDVENHDKILFTGTSFVHLKDNVYSLSGKLTIKGVTKDVTLDVIFGGMNKDPWGNEKAAFEISGKINRKDWGLNWNAALETGGMLVSEEVKINAELQLVKQIAE